MQETPLTSPSQTRNCPRLSLKLCQNCSSPVQVISHILGNQITLTSYHLGGWNKQGIKISVKETFFSTPSAEPSHWLIHKHWDFRSTSF